MKEEPSVLDYVKALLTPWRGKPPHIQPDETPAHPSVQHRDVPSTSQSDVPPQEISIPLASVEAEQVLQPSEASSSADAEQIIKPSVHVASWPWRSLVGMGLGLIAQRSLEPGPERTWTTGLPLYLIAAAWVGWAGWRGEWKLAPQRAIEHRIDQYFVRQVPFWIGSALALLAFLTFGGNLFSPINLFLWIFALIFLLQAFWVTASPSQLSWAQLCGFLNLPIWNIRLSRWALLVIGVSALVIFFRVYRLDQVPPEMVSDHAEKLLDIWDVLHGETHIFFPRNTGREAIQMYLTAGVIQLFGTGYSFLSMKIGTAIAGLITLVYVYLLGEEVGNRRVALLAMLLVGIAYWPNVITRVALRFSLYPLFVAPTLYYLLRGIRRSSRNDFILAGIAMGLGLHGYTPFRIMPFVVVTAVGLYLIHGQSKGLRKQTLWGTVLLILFALIIFLPLLRFWVENPEAFNYRTFTRLGSLERPLPGPAGLIFLQNLWNAVTMFAWSNGEIWLHSIPYRPALDVVSGTLFYLGVVLLFVRYLRQRHWLDLFLILSVPLLMIPSILSLAFPSENPALNRTAGAMVPVFLIAGLSLDGFLSALEERLGKPRGQWAAWGAGVLLIVWSAAQNFDLVFNQYQHNYERSSWNSSEIGNVIRDFSISSGSSENAYVVGYPHWVDTRLVGINAGIPTKDYAIWTDHFQETINNPNPKLFIIYPEDVADLEVLKLLYPKGYLQTFHSQRENKDFWMLYVFPDQ